MNSFRVRLSIIMIVLVGLSVTAASIFMVKSFERNHLEAMQENMVREMKLILSNMDWKSGDP